MKRESIFILIIGCTLVGYYLYSKTGDSMKLMSLEFSQGQTIPKKFTGEGEDISPLLRWENIPENTKSFVLIVDDPDAPTPKPWVHWVVYNIPANTKELPEGVNPQKLGADIGKTSFENKIGYGGPMPPQGHGVHKYHFKLYALDTTLNLSKNASKEDVMKAMEGHILEKAELIGTYERK